ncbi:9308_t:CDS:2, partial [Acaulospora morrowiae]
MSESNNQERRNEITRCLELLSPSSSDDAKFVALMLLPRLLQQDEETTKIIFDAIDFKFLERLMRTERFTEENLPDYTLKTIAVHILSCFCAMDELLTKKQIHARIPTLSTLLPTNINEELAQDILKILLRLASAKQGLTQFINNKVVSNVLQRAKSSTNETRDMSLQVIYYTTTSVIADYHLFDSKIIQTFLLTTFGELSEILRTDQTMFKFNCLDIFVQIFTHMTDQVAQEMVLKDESQTNVWLQNAKYGLRDILRSKIGSEQRDKALSLIMLLLHYFDATWLFTPNISSKKDHHSVVENIDDFKFAVLVVQLACVEIRLMLDEISDKLEKKDFKPVERHEVMLPACYTILEKSIEHLSQIESSLEINENGNSTDPTKSKLDPELLLRLKSTMVETFRIIMEYLLNIK